jgi:hypothetical protein
MNNEHILDGLDPDLIREMTTRREALKGGGAWLSKVALASVPLAIAGMAKEAFGQSGLPADIVSVLNFALTLEELEAEFYTIATGGMAMTGGQVVTNLIPSEDRPIFDTLRDHEQAHVRFLRQVLGAQAVAKPNFDFTAGGMFSPFTNYAQFLVLSQGFEDLGVRAYKGQAPALMANKDVLTAALTIHSVEARHASEIRRLRGERANTPEQNPFKGWITLRNVDAAAAPIQAVYNAGNPPATFPAEDNVTQLTVNTATLAVPTGQTATINASSASESFDEPLDRATVLSIAAPFIRS